MSLAEAYVWVAQHRGSFSSLPFRIKHSFLLLRFHGRETCEIIAGYGTRWLEDLFGFGAATDLSRLGCLPGIRV